MNIYWFSFSYRGYNNGVCIVQADDEHLALEKTINLGIQPSYDDIACYKIEDITQEACMQFNRLYSTEEMVELGYNTSKI